ncbi:MAG: D-tyrosyl-tRNA(Tyr) deacylase [Clostridia bacterium]|nr:D-tyrosyl-tRNA(Tyr) deacylase [Deltaproteobacteria bacterium]
MRVVIQRCREGSVTVDGEILGAVGKGYVLLVGIAKGDSAAQVDAMAAKVAQLRVFEDDARKMNLSLLDVGGGCLVISQFTLVADLSRGRRPFFGEAETPAIASALIERLADSLRAFGVTVATGRFGADMKVTILNDGPVTIVLDG